MCVAKKHRNTAKCVKYDCTRNDADDGLRSPNNTGNTQLPIQVYDDIDDLSVIASDWKSLLSQTPNASFFQSLAWLKVYWKHFAADQVLKVLVVSEADAITGILPFVIRKEKTKVGTIAYLTYPLDYWGPFYGPIGAHPAQVLATGIEYLANQRKRDWDTLELRWVGVTPEDYSDCRETLMTNGLSPVSSVLDKTAYIDLTSGSWSDYLASRRSKWRNNLRRWERRMNDQGNLRFVRIRSAECGSDPRWDVFEDCMTVARKSWQAESTDGTTICHEEIKSFVTDAHQAATESDSVDMNLFYLNDIPVAFAYNYTYQGNVVGLRVGHTPELRSHGVGNLLYARAIEDSFERGDWRYDMGPGSLAIKRHIQTDQLPIYRLSCFRKLSVKQQLLRWRRVQEAEKSTATASAESA